ncbi:MAG: sel1 repeat family protein [Rhodospirillales bacterium]|nr:sel1 repeat family protein [Rhodospirillales bacterium]
MLSRIITVLLVTLGYVSAGAAVSAATTPEIARTHRGINIIAMPLPADNTFDIDLYTPAQAVDALQQAIDLIYAQSKFSVAAFERLKKAGKVTVVYDPEFPKEQLSSVTIAAFFPDFFQKEGHLKEFLVVVGRYGVKWPIDKLAAVVVHELGGHGYQHLRGRTKTDRKIDRECEAQLYEEAALQDFKVARATADMIRFRREMQTNWCSDFRRYMHDRDPKLMALWNNGKPFVSDLLAVFEDYLTHLQDTGVSGDAVAAVAKKRQLDLLEMGEKAKHNKSGPDLYAVAQRHFNGMGTPKSLSKARSWFLLSANTGYPPAQLAMGLMLEHGLAGKPDNSAAYSWYFLAAGNGIAKAKQRLEALSSKLSQSEIEKAKAQARAENPGNG